MKYEYKPEEVNSHLTNIFVCDLGTFHTNRAVPYWVSLYWLGKLADEYMNVAVIEQMTNSKSLKKDKIVFERTGCVNKMLDRIATSKR